jgi:hypothetical protein
MGRMRNFPPISIPCIVLIILVGCSSAHSTDNPAVVATGWSELPPEFEGTEHSPTYTARPASLPSATPNLTQAAIYPDNITAQAAQETLIAQYPHLCRTTYAPREYSPDKLWLVEYCWSEDDQSPILTFSNRDNNVLWKMVFRDYIQPGEFLPDGGLAVVHWPKDDSYVYFNSYVSGSGGECFVGGNVLNYGKGLFRLDLPSGNVTTILPLQENFTGYDFSFSPTDRRLIYDSRPLGLNILDIRTGLLTPVFSASKYDGAGGYLWSPDGLQAAYSTVMSINYGESVQYALRSVDVLSGNERILLESPENCFTARSWSADNIITIESYDKNYNLTLIEYDWNSNRVIREAAATPRP